MLALLQLALGAADLAKRGWSYIAARIGLGRGPAAKVTIEALLWDLTAMNTEAIVNSATTDLRMDRGLAGAIKRAAGEVVEREAMAQAPVLQGRAVATSAGQLGDPIKWVIHAVSMGPHHEISESMVRAATASALALAADMGIRSIAFPAMCTDAGELRLWGVAEAMVGEAKLMALHARASSGSNLPWTVKAPWPCFRMC